MKVSFNTPASSFSIADLQKLMPIQIKTVRNHLSKRKLAIEKISQHCQNVKNQSKIKPLQTNSNLMVKSTDIRVQSPGSETLIQF